MENLKNMRTFDDIRYSKCLSRAFTGKELFSLDIVACQGGGVSNSAATRKRITEELNTLCTGDWCMAQKS